MVDYANDRHVQILTQLSDKIPIGKVFFTKSHQDNKFLNYQVFSDVNVKIFEKIICKWFFLLKFILFLFFSLIRRIWMTEINFFNKNLLNILYKVFILSSQMSNGSLFYMYIFCMYMFFLSRFMETKLKRRMIKQTVLPLQTIQTYCLCVKPW